MVYLCGYFIVTSSVIRLTHSIALQFISEWIYFLVFNLIFLSVRLLPYKRREVYGDTPLTAWKVAQVVTLGPPELQLHQLLEQMHREYPAELGPPPLMRKYRFRPLFSPTSYDAESVARCSWGESETTIPHEARGHYCGFYAYMKQSRAYTELRRACTVLLEVELYGDVIEGSRKILRGQYQRVLSVKFLDLCNECSGPLPRLATGLMINQSSVVVPVCDHHAPLEPERRLRLQDVRRELGTGVEFRQTWTGILSGMLRHE